MLGEPLIDIIGAGNTVIIQPRIEQLRRNGSKQDQGEKRCP